MNVDYFAKMLIKRGSGAWRKKEKVEVSFKSNCVRGEAENKGQ